MISVWYVNSHTRLVCQLPHASGMSTPTRVKPRAVGTGASQANKTRLTSPTSDRRRESSEWESVETLTDQAYRELEEEITILRIPPGAIVSEALLSERAGLGRTPTREALQRLAREGLVVIMSRRGVVVSDMGLAVATEGPKSTRKLTLGLGSAIGSSRPHFGHLTKGCGWSLRQQI